MMLRWLKNLLEVDVSNTIQGNSREKGERLIGNGRLPMHVGYVVLLEGSGRLGRKADDQKEERERQSGEGGIVRSWERSKRKIDT